MRAAAIPPKVLHLQPATVTSRGPNTCGSFSCCCEKARSMWPFLIKLCKKGTYFLFQRDLAHFTMSSRSCANETSPTHSNPPTTFLPCVFNWRFSRILSKTSLRRCADCSSTTFAVAPASFFTPIFFGAFATTPPPLCLTHAPRAIDGALVWCLAAQPQH